MVFNDYKHLFYDLEMPQIDELTSFSLIPFTLERQVTMQNGGLDLSSKPKLKRLSEKKLKHYRELVPGFDIRDLEDFSELGLFRGYKKIKEPCSMLLGDMPELMSKIGEIYQIAYAHYVVAANEKSGFPNFWCGDSGRNIAASSWVMGFLNAAYVLDDPDDHGYNAFPFTIKEPHTEGVVIVDPTSDQLWESRVGPRNMILVISGKEWVYKTSRSFGKDLFPTHAFHIGSLLHADYFRHETEYMAPIMEYFAEAFRNPVDMDKLK